MNIKQKISCGFWNVGIIDMPVEEFLEKEKLPEIKWMRHNYRNSFYADPFPEGEDAQYYYLLAEEYSYITGKGIIVRLIIEKSTMKLVSKETVIKSTFHLSFPFLYKGAIIPEQYRSGNLISYMDGKEKVVCDYPVIDPVFLDYREKKYLFGTMPCDDNKGHNRSLFWFEFIEDKYELKQEKPIKENIRSARAAGVFFEIGRSLYRAAQDCERIYGGQIRIMKVNILGDEYSEEEVRVVNSNNCDKFNVGLHTFNPWKNIIVVDGFQYETRFMMKPVYVINRIIRRFK